MIADPHFRVDAGEASAQANAEERTKLNNDRADLVLQQAELKSDEEELKLQRIQLQADRKENASALQVALSHQTWLLWVTFATQTDNLPLN